MADEKTGLSAVPAVPVAAASIEMGGSKLSSVVPIDAVHSVPAPPPPPPLSQSVPASHSEWEAIKLGFGRRMEFIQNLGRWCAVIIPVSIVIGIVCAFFLWSLEEITSVRFYNLWLFYLLPVGGIFVESLYLWLSPKQTTLNMDLLFEQITATAPTLKTPTPPAQTLGSGSAAPAAPVPSAGGGSVSAVGEALTPVTPSAAVPLQMTPLVLTGTLVTHLCGGSAGREGTALQMAGSIISSYPRFLQWISASRIARVHPRTMRVLTLCSFAAGFGGVFGTPFAGAVFAIEVGHAGQMSFKDVIPCFIAGITSDITARVMLSDVWPSAEHTDYSRLVPSLTDSPESNSSVGHFHFVLNLKVMTAAIIFGLVASVFAVFVDRWKHLLSAIVKRATSRLGLDSAGRERSKSIVSKFIPVVFGGLVLILIVVMIRAASGGSDVIDDYLGLGTRSSRGAAGVTITSCFRVGGAYWWSWCVKLIFTAITVGSGFKGGEVTSLFFIGAALGNATGLMLGESAHIDMFAALVSSQPLTDWWWWGVVWWCLFASSYYFDCVVMD